MFKAWAGGWARGQANLSTTCRSTSLGRGCHTPSDTGSFPDTPPWSLSQHVPPGSPCSSPTWPPDVHQSRCVSHPAAFAHTFPAPQSALFSLLYLNILHPPRPSFSVPSSETQFLNSRLKEVSFHATPTRYCLKFYFVLLSVTVGFYVSDYQQLIGE